MPLSASDFGAGDKEGEARNRPRLLRTTCTLKSLHDALDTDRISLFCLVQDRQVEQSRLGAGEEAEARRGEASLPLRPRSSRGWPLVQLPLWYGIRYPHDRDLVDQSLTEVESPAPIRDNSPGQSINRSHHALQLLLYYLVTYSATNNKCSDFPCENLHCYCGISKPHVRVLLSLLTVLPTRTLQLC